MTYIELVKKFPLRPIYDEKTYDEALKIINILSHQDNLTPDEGDYLDVLTDLGLRYLRNRFPIMNLNLRDSILVNFVLQFSPRTDEDHKTIVKFNKQLAKLVERLYNWTDENTEDIEKAYVSVLGSEIFFLVVKKTDQKLEDSLAELDIEVAQDPELDLIRLVVFAYSNKLSKYCP